MKEHTQGIRQKLEDLFKDETDTDRIMAIAGIKQELDSIDKQEDEYTSRITKDAGTIRDLVLHGTTSKSVTPDDETPERSPSEVSFGEFSDSINAH